MRRCAKYAGGVGALGGVVWAAATLAAGGTPVQAFNIGFALAVAFGVAAVFVVACAKWLSEELADYWKGADAASKQTRIDKLRAGLWALVEDDRPVGDYAGTDDELLGKVRSSLRHLRDSLDNIEGSWKTEADARRRLMDAVHEAAGGEGATDPEGRKDAVSLVEWLGRVRKELAAFRKDMSEAFGFGGGISDEALVQSVKRRVELIKALRWDLGLNVGGPSLLGTREALARERQAAAKWRAVADDPHQEAMEQ